MRNGPIQTRLKYLRKALNHAKEKCMEEPLILAEFYTDLGALLVQAGEFDEAFKLLKEGLDQCGDDFMIFETLAQLEVSRGNLSEAIGYLK